MMKLRYRSIIFNDQESGFHYNSSLGKYTVIRVPCALLCMSSCP
ncbi:Uncharacterised protein [Vibrio cholerae]|nr:Uncharacterised protein [Vibrio cholerae]